jgi:hypothetical protein
MELVVCWPTEDHVVGTFEMHNLKCKYLLNVIIHITEAHMKFNVV